MPLSEIARRAGLGRATVYRHFPDRHALGHAVVAQQLDRLRQFVRADEGCFRSLLEHVLTDQLSRRPLVRLLGELPLNEQRRFADALIRELAPALRRAQDEGEIRTDLEPAHLLLVMEMVEAAVNSPLVVVSPETLRNFITVILDGLCPQPRP